MFYIKFSFLQNWVTTRLHESVLICRLRCSWTNQDDRIFGKTKCTLKILWNSSWTHVRSCYFNQLDQSPQTNTNLQKTQENGHFEQVKKKKKTPTRLSASANRRMIAAKDTYDHRPRSQQPAALCSCQHDRLDTLTLCLTSIDSFNTTMCLHIEITHLAGSETWLLRTVPLLRAQGGVQKASTEEHRWVNQIKVWPGNIWSTHAAVSWLVCASMRLFQS